MKENPDLVRLREVLNDAAVLCGRLSSQVSLADLPSTCAGAVAATRHAVLGAQQCAAVIEQIRTGLPAPSSYSGERQQVDHSL